MKRPYNDEEDEEEFSDFVQSEQEDEQLEESAQEKRIRLSRLYLEKVMKNTDSKENFTNFNQPLPTNVQLNHSSLYKTTKPIISIVQNSKFQFILQKKSSYLLQYDFELKNYKKWNPILKGPQKHFQITAIACSEEWLCVSLFKPPMIQIYSLPDFELKHTFTTQNTGKPVEDDKQTVHQNQLSKFHSPIQHLLLHPPTQSLFSCSLDRTIRLFHLETMAFVEAMFGHQDQIQQLNQYKSRDQYGEQRVWSVGGRDQTVRCWKVLEGTQLVYRMNTKRKLLNFKFPGIEKETADMTSFAKQLKETLLLDESGSLDSMICLKGPLFVTGSDGGALSLWHQQKKKPIQIIPNAHGRQLKFLSHSEVFDYSHQQPMPDSLTEFLNHPDCDSSQWISKPHWITCFCSLNEQLFFSGGTDGSVHLWSIDENEKLKWLKSKRFEGIINALSFDTQSNILSVAVGRENSRGRWNVERKCKQGLYKVSVELLFADKD